MKQLQKDLEGALVILNQARAIVLVGWAVCFIVNGVVRAWNHSTHRASHSVSE